MKVKPEHVAIMRKEIQAFVCKSETVTSDGMDLLVKQYEEGKFPRSEQVKDLDTRFCWDMVRNAHLDAFIIFSKETSAFRQGEELLYQKYIFN
jgi:hypothetical protein